jgi:hypothetical protein
MKDFTSVDVRGPFALESKQGKEFKLSVTLDDNLFEHLQVEKEGKILSIGFKGKNLSIRLSEDHQPKASVTMPTLEGLKLNGASHATAEEFKVDGPVHLTLVGASQFKGALRGGEVKIDADGASTVILSGSGKNMRVKTNGASKLRLRDYTASGERLIVDANGAATVTLKGNVTAGVLKAIGASTLDLRDVSLAGADVTLVGASNATVQVSEKLDYSVRGASHLNYFGDPKIGKSEKKDVSSVSHKR